VVSVLIEILVPLPELAVDPETPDAVLWAGEKNAPTTFLIDLY